MIVMLRVRLLERVQNWPSGWGLMLGRFVGLVDVILVFNCSVFVGECKPKTVYIR